MDDETRHDWSRHGVELTAVLIGHNDNRVVESLAREARGQDIGKHRRHTADPPATPLKLKLVGDWPVGRSLQVGAGGTVGIGVKNFVAPVKNWTHKTSWSRALSSNIY